MFPLFTRYIVEPSAPRLSRRKDSANHYDYIDDARLHNPGYQVGVFNQLFRAQVSVQTMYLNLVSPQDDFKYFSGQQPTQESAEPFHLRNLTCTFRICKEVTTTTTTPILTSTLKSSRIVETDRCLLLHLPMKKSMSNLQSARNNPTRSPDLRALDLVT